MNAKTAQRLESIKKGTYACQKCQTQFKYASGDLKCPKCGATKAEDLLSVYMENDPERDEMLSRDEFAAGD